MAKAPTPTSDAAWWLDSPRDQFYRRCVNQFDVRLSCKLGKGVTLRANADATSKKLGMHRSSSAMQSNAGIRRQGFGIGHW